MMDTNVPKLQSLTDSFFARHWDHASREPLPLWSAPWRFEGELPNNEYRGCYAFLREDRVMYIGVAVSVGDGIYQGHGLGSRIARYWAVDQAGTQASGRRVYKPSEQLSTYGIEAIVTLPIMDRNQDYLAAALEIYLIREIQPALNKTHRSNGNSYRK